MEEVIPELEVKAFSSDFPASLGLTLGGVNCIFQSNLNSANLKSEGVQLCKRVPYFYYSDEVITTDCVSPPPLSPYVIYKI